MQVVNAVIWISACVIFVFVFMLFFSCWYNKEQIRILVGSLMNQENSKKNEIKKNGSR